MRKRSGQTFFSPLLVFNLLLHFPILCPQNFPSPWQLFGKEGLPGEKQSRAVGAQGFSCASVGQPRRRQQELSRAHRGGCRCGDILQHLRQLRAGLGWAGHPGTAALRQKQPLCPPGGWHSCSGGGTEQLRLGQG